MVNITIFIEGDVPESNPDVLTIGSASPFREAFYRLFLKIVDTSNINLNVNPYGTITQTKVKLKETKDSSIKTFFLIDLDAKKSEKIKRLSYYSSEDQQRIYFMIQRMESWILSQPERLDDFGVLKRLIRKRPDKKISDHSFLKNKHPEEIDKPDEKLDTLLREFFDELRKEKTKGKHYRKLKDGPDLIELLKPQELYKTFDEFQMLIDKIKSYRL